jgi:hypothetical protein
MIRRISLLAVSIGLVAGLVAAAADATFVLKSGERHSGQLVYQGTDKVSLVINGRERAFPFDDIALIAFTNVDITRQEVDKLPTSANPPELEMHMLVFRDGRTLKGKLHDFKGEMISFDSRGDGGQVRREQFQMDQVARLYLSAPASRSLFGNAPAGGVVTQPGEVPGRRTVRVEANRAWTDTGLDVRMRDRITFNANGTIRIGNEEAGPNGSSERPTRPSIPVRTLNVGALIGRIDNGTPFAIGSRTQPVVMRSSGRLFLGVNDDHLADNSGYFEVIVSR